MSIPELQQLGVPLVILVIAFVLARLDARDRRAPPLIWPNTAASESEAPTEPPIPPRGIRVQPREAPLVDAPTVELSPHQLEAIHRRASSKPSGRIGRRVG